MTRADVDEVDVESVDFGHELRQGTSMITRTRAPRSSSSPQTRQPPSLSSFTPDAGAIAERSQGRSELA